MTHSAKPNVEERVLVLAPTAGDAALTQTLLTEAGLECLICSNLEQLCRAAEAGAGAVLATEEVLASEDAHCLVDVLRQQAPWSDLPIVLLTTHGADSPMAAWAMDVLGSVTVLERPVRVTTLVSTLRTALRARQRQYEQRRQMAALRRQGERLRLLWEAAAVILSADRPDAMLQALFARIAPQFGLDTYFNFSVDETGKALRLESCAGIPPEEARRIGRLEFGQAVCGTVALQRRPIIATHIQQSDDPKVQLVKGYGVRAYACNPLLAGDRLLGTLSFASRSRDEFDAEEIEFFETISRYVTYAYERRLVIRQLQEADRKKDDFLATLAHELRNPLAPVRNAAEFLRLKGQADPDVQNARNIIERQVQQMSRLVDELLDISRITRGKITLHRERVALSAVVANAVEASRPLIEAAGHELTVSLPPQEVYLEGDPMRLAQVFGNLLTNAAKYTDRGGRIRVTASVEGGASDGRDTVTRWHGDKVTAGDRVTRWQGEKVTGSDGAAATPEGSATGSSGHPVTPSPCHPFTMSPPHHVTPPPPHHVTVSVRDSGIGIAAEHLPRLFEMFSQVAPAHERSQGGLGIGLALVQRLVQMHGGTVEAHSDGLGLGSEFCVHLPVLAQAAGARDGVDGVHKKPGKPGKAPCRILIADDNADAAQSLAMMLSLMGHEVCTAGDGLAALEMAGEFRPEVILLDIGMPRLNGYETARRIREQPWGRHAVLAALTGWGQEEDRRQSRAAGFDHHFVKPVEPAVLDQLLDGVKAEAT